MAENEATILRRAAIALALEEKPGLSVDELAAQHDISKRTIYNDLAAINGKSPKQRTRPEFLLPSRVSDRTVLEVWNNRTKRRAGGRGGESRQERSPLPSPFIEWLPQGPRNGSSVQVRRERAVRMVLPTIVYRRAADLPKSEKPHIMSLRSLLPPKYGGPPRNGK